MKLELKHLAGYLPYGVKIETPYGVEILEALGEDWIFTEQKRAYHFIEKPILRPLSDLTKEIEVNGKKFVPIEYFEDKYYTLDLHKQCLRLLENENWINQSDYMLVDYLLSWHFDIHGSIEKGLAIDINTI